jgi:hypothetical protein
MEQHVLLTLKKDTKSLLFLLVSLRTYYMENDYQKALTKINESIIANAGSLIIIDKQLNELKTAW